MRRNHRPADTPSAARRLAAPRLAGRRLVALARLLRTPGIGANAARLAMRQLLIRPLRRRVAAHSELRSIIPFRAQPRRANHD